MAFISSSTERVEMPWTWAAWITVVSVFSAIRRGSRNVGTWLPRRSFGVEPQGGSTSSTVPVHRISERHSLRSGCVQAAPAVRPFAMPRHCSSQDSTASATRSGCSGNSAWEASSITTDLTRLPNSFCNSCQAVFGLNDHRTENVQHWCAPARPVGGARDGLGRLMLHLQRRGVAPREPRPGVVARREKRLTQHRQPLGFRSAELAHDQRRLGDVRGHLRGLSCRQDDRLHQVLTVARHHS